MKLRSGWLCLTLCTLVSLAGCGGGGGSSNSGGSSGGGSNSPTLSSIDVAPANPSISVGTTQQFTATGHYSDGSTKDLSSSATWTSSSTATATISNAGLATAVAAGTTTITATSGSISGTTSLTVTGTSGPTLTSITVTPSTIQIVTGTTQQFTATGHYSDSSTQDLTSSVTWTSSNTPIATISNTGLATGVSAGYTTIAATDGNVTGTATLIVADSVLSSITVTPATPSIVAGNTQQFTATGHYSDGSTSNITNSCTWNSSNTSIATIVSTGLATGVAAGSTTITATLDSISGTTSLTVTSPTLKSIAITPDSPQAAVGGTVQLTATGTYADNSTQNITSTVTWSSDNTSIATVNSAGIVTGVAAGTTTVHATSNSIDGTANLTVTPANLTAWWRFNEAGGTIAEDSSGNGYNANLYGGLTYTSGQIGGGIIANGSSQLMKTPAINLSSTNALTLAGWVARVWTGTNTKVLAELGYDYSAATDGFVFYVDDTTDCGASPAIYIGFKGDVGSTFNCYTPPSDGNWHHIAMVLDKSKSDSTAIQLYIDGSLQTILSSKSVSANTNNFGSEQLYMFSQSGNSEFASGIVSDLRLYSRALSDSEIGQLYSLGSTTATVQSLSISPQNVGIAAGQPLQFDALGTYTDSSVRDLSTAVTWSSSSPSVATILPGGLATGVAAGSTNIQAAINSKNASTGLSVGTTATIPGKLVQFSTGDDGSTTVATGVLGAPMTAGNMLLVFSHWDDQSITATVSDSEGDTFTPIFSNPINQGTQRFQIWYAKNIIGGAATSITVTYSAKTSVFSLVDVAEYSGLDQNSPLGTFTYATGTGASLDSGSISVPTANTQTIIGIFGDDAYVSPFTSGDGFTQDGFDASTMYESKGATTAGSYNATATSEGSANWIAVVMSFNNYTN
ncbi:MAG TPA: Ig-like domain-containing protein [Terracidiphilus sp.]|nr:Ig-like domain-containing protein [Terracidiphilus sp.]